MAIISELLLPETDQSTEFWLPSTFWWLKLEVTTFGVLEELKEELRLKQLLWESVQEWDSLQNAWKKVRGICYGSSIKYDNIFWFSLWSCLLSANFSNWTLIRSAHRSWNMTNTLISWRRVCQRTLWCPAWKTEWKPWDTWWAVVHLISRLLKMHFWLSESIYPLLIKLPVITDLRRLCVEQESWKTLEAVLGTSLDVETLTLCFLEETNIISHATKIQEVTNQLSKTNFNCFQWTNPPHESWKWYMTLRLLDVCFKHASPCT